MKTPTGLVTAALTAAILLAALFLIATGTRGEGAELIQMSSPATPVRPPAGRMTGSGG